MVKLLFSVIVPVYNTDAEFFINCIKSIVTQASSDIEVIIVDDGSSQDIAELCDQLEANYDVIRTIHQNNKGLAAARNTGVINANGDWIIHVDSDDWLRSGLFDALHEKIKVTNYDILVFEYEASDGKRSISHKLKSKKAFDRPYSNLKNEILKATLRASDTFADLAINTTWGKAYKRSFIMESNIIFDESLRRAQDVPYNLEAFSRARRVGFLEGIYYIYRADNLSLSRGYNRLNYERLTLSVKACENFINHYDEGENLKEAFYAFTRSCFISLVKVDFLNPNNPRSYNERKKQFKKALQQEPYKSAFAFSRTGKCRFPGNVEEILISGRAFKLLEKYEGLYKIIHRIIKE